jgi:probable HAF family extracellular repeat protein
VRRTQRRIGVLAAVGIVTAGVVATAGVAKPRTAKPVSPQDKSEALAVNLDGDVAGWSFAGGGIVTHPFFWTKAKGMVDVGTLGGPNGTAVGVNANDVVVGSADTTAGARHAFAWTPKGGMVDLGTLGGSNSSAEAVNESGEVVGSADDGSTTRATLWTQAHVATPLAPTTSAAHAINAAGDVAGEYFVGPAGIMHAFFRSSTGEFVDLGTPHGVGSTFANAINANDEIVGYAFGGDAFSWTPQAGMVDLGTLGGATSKAVGVDDDGDIAGTSDLANGTHHAFIWMGKKKKMVDLGTLGGESSQAVAINALGQVIGTSRAADGSEQAFVWTKTRGVVDLGTSAGRFASTAGAINAHGEVVGESYVRATNLDDAFFWRSGRGLVDLGTLRTPIPARNH